MRVPQRKHNRNDIHCGIVCFPATSDSLRLCWSFFVSSAQTSQIHKRES